MTRTHSQLVLTEQCRLHVSLLKQETGSDPKQISSTHIINIYVVSL